MNFKKLSKFIIGFGILVLVFGGVKWSNNQPQKFDSSKSEQTIFGRNDLGNMLNVQMGNLERESERGTAKNIMIFGAIVSFVGIGVFASAKDK